jgi:hypothetical protein
MLAFADAEGCTAWLRAVPLTNIPRYYETVLGQLKRLAEVDFAPRERARIAEVMREPVMFLHTELARRYAGKPQPAAERENEAAEQALALWHALWSQYSACLKPLLEGDPDLQGVKAKVLQRGLWVGKQLMLVYGLARRHPASAVWQELHAYYRLAEILDCAVTAVSDELIPNAVGVSCYSTYSHALLLDLSDPCAMTVRQIELTDRWLSMWARKVFPYPEQRDRGSPDRDRSGGAQRRATLAGGSAQRRRGNTLRLSGQAHNQRPRPAQAAGKRRESGGTAVGPRRCRRSVHGAFDPSRFALVRAAGTSHGW